jgi:hypothetical protein
MVKARGYELLTPTRLPLRVNLRGFGLSIFKQQMDADERDY